MKLRIYPLCLIFVISSLSFLITDIHWGLLLAVHNDAKLFFSRIDAVLWEGSKVDEKFSPMCITLYLSALQFLLFWAPIITWSG